MTTSPPLREIPTTELADHTTRTSAWMLIDGKVHDITAFLDDHPGGDEILLDATGRDATQEFEDVGHSREARAQLAEMVIGVSRPPTPEEAAVAAEKAAAAGVHLATGADGGRLNMVLKVGLPVLLVVLAVLLRMYTT
ncbi:hypothetical protein MMPV_001798 [Pyropia vietnamensis]